ncbi:hypothetical protein H4S01_001685 [Coemansia sp. RSA 2610]|nr:hypothetical protein H4S01_001685 [Coemansia sp. RSA 2610]
MDARREVRPLAGPDKAWATRQIATIVGATTEDAEPLAEFLLAIDDPNELQGQLLDMLGESPLALDFASSLIAKRFPVENKPPPPLPPRSSPTPSRGGDSNVVAYRKADPNDIAYFGGASSRDADRQKQQQQQTAAAEEQPEVQKSQRQMKKERQEQARKEREEAEKRRQRAKRKRVKCECQASEHPLLTNCLTCGRIVCDSEGPGPCMFCGSEVDSPDQQLEQHMQRLLACSQESGPTQSSGKGKGSRPGSGSGSAKPLPAGSSYSMKVGGAARSAAANPQTLWSEPESSSPATSVATLADSAELSEEDYMKLAFQVLKIDRATADEASIHEAESWVKATRRKERLLGFDRTAAQRTRLIDQSSDFDPDAIGKWMSPEEKAQAERRQAARRRAEEEREARLRRGMRVLRLNFQDASVDIHHEDPEDAKDREPAATEPTTAAAKPAVKPAAKQSQAASSAGAFAHNPLLDEVNEPKFILEKKKPTKKARGKTQQQQPHAGNQPATDDVSRTRQMLRVQSDMTDAIF